MGDPDIERVLRAFERLSSLLNQVDEDEPSTLEGVKGPLAEALEALEGLSGLPSEKLQSFRKAAEGLLCGDLGSLSRVGEFLDEIMIHLSTSPRDEHAAEPARVAAPEKDAVIHDVALQEKEAEELSMDLEVLCGLAEELQPAFVPGMVNILERNLDRETLPAPLSGALREVREALGRYERGDMEAGNEALSILRRAREILSAALGGPAGKDSGLTGEQGPWEEEIERLEELEALLVEEEKRENPDLGMVAQYLSYLAERSEELKLSELKEDFKSISGSIRKLNRPHQVLDAIFKLKDELQIYFKSFLEGSDISPGVDGIRDALVHMLGHGAPAEAGQTSTSSESGEFEAGPGLPSGDTPSEHFPFENMSTVNLDIRPVVGIPVDEEELTDFVAEAPEDLQRVETALLELEKDPESREWLNEAFRGFHNLKGSAGFLKLEDMVNVAHAAENLLSEAREGRIRLTGVYADLALEALDLLREMLRRVEDHLGGTIYRSPEGYPQVLARLRSWKEARLTEDTGATLREEPASAAAAAEITRDRSKGEDSRAQAFPGEATGLTDAVASLKGGTPPSGQVTSDRLESKPEELVPAPSHPGKEPSREQFVKVSTTRLDNLIDVVGELVIAHSMVAQEEELRTTKNPRLAKNLSQLSKIIRELQELAMALRMVSLKGTFQKMARAARDLSVRSGVPVDFTYSGEDTEIDRNVVEEITNPLVHLIRNAIDHGIEPPDERRSRGKPERGRIHLRGYHQGGNVVIELEDDGRGIDPEKVLAKARERSLVGEGEELSREEILQLIFREGFSTADRVTDISGRGVGMDVVKRAVEGLRGRVEVHSELGRGTRVVMRLPLTLAIIDGMVTRVGSENYILPAFAIKESFRPTGGQVKTVAGRGELILSRGELIPLFRLHRLFGVPGAVEDPYRALVLVIGENGRKCGLLVDEIEGQQQVVIKPLGESLPRLPGVAGGAIMGSGRVALILDPQELL
ncbi:MAG: chemotaxis protein CheA, partial [Candidatus Geothermincolales bacterium]